MFCPLWNFASIKGPQMSFLGRGLLAAKALRIENNYKWKETHTHTPLTISTGHEPSLRHPLCAPTRLSIRRINQRLLVSRLLSAHVTLVHQHRGSCHTTLTINYRNYPLNPHVALQTVLKPRNDRQHEGKHLDSYGADERRKWKF